MNKRIRDKAWFPYTVALCIAVTLYVALTHLHLILGALSTFLGYFKAFFFGCILAYLIHPLVNFFHRSVFKTLRKEGLSWMLSIALSMAALLLILLFLLGTLVPQLIASVTTLLDNMDGYLVALNALVERLGMAETLNPQQWLTPSGGIVSTVASFLRNNAGSILSITTSAGGAMANWLIAVILSIYLLAEKNSLKGGAARLLHALLPPARYEKVTDFFVRCDRILSQYIIFSLLDSLIVGIANAVFMLCLGMQYVGLVSLVVGLTNLIPTFGPLIGYVVGGFILLLVNPIHALLFVIFSLVLQTLDGYVIKPKLFGNSLGVSGLLILTAVIVCGKMFGIVGMLLAIPLAAILDFVYHEALLPALERRRAAISE